MLPTEIFLSHSDQDRQFVEELVDMMRRHGLRVWYSRSNYGQLSWTLFSIQLIDFTQTFEQGCRDLLRVWNLGYQAA